MDDPLIEDQLLGLAAKPRLITGLVLTVLGGAATVWLWQAGWFVGIAFFALVMGLLLAWTGRQDLARERAFDAEVARAHAEWAELERGVAATQREGKSVARFLQQQGYREYSVRRWIATELSWDAG